MRQKVWKFSLCSSIICSTCAPGQCSKKILINSKPVDKLAKPLECLCKVVHWINDRRGSSSPARKKNTFYKSSSKRSSMQTKICTVLKYSSPISECFFAARPKLFRECLYVWKYTDFMPKSGRKTRSHSTVELLSSITKIRIKSYLLSNRQKWTAITYYISESKLT